MKAFAEIERKCTSSAYAYTFPSMTIMPNESPRQIMPVAADTWREKFSNINVAVRNVNISV